MLVDANLLVYAIDEDDPSHARANRWLTDALGGERPVGLPWESLTAFVRLVTNPRVKTEPLDATEAWGFVADWLAADQVWVPQPSSAHTEILGRLISSYRVRANLVQDAHLAAIAIGHGLAVYSADSDFARFAADVEWRNPLTEVA